MSVYKKIIGHFSPLWTFVLGMLGTLIITIFLPMIFSAQTDLSNNPAVASGAYWGLQAAVTSTRLIVFLACFAVTLINTAVCWLVRKG